MNGFFSRLAGKSREELIDYGALQACDSSLEPPLELEDAPDDPDDGPANDAWISDLSGKASRPLNPRRP